MLTHRRWLYRRPQHQNNLLGQSELVARTTVIRSCEGEPCSCS
jgi:hypothetical protein